MGSCFSFSATGASALGTMAKHILVTGGNSGIGHALCKLLATSTQPPSDYPTPVPPPCYVYLGARDPVKGEAAVKAIIDEFPDASGKIEMLQIDVSDDASCAAAAEALKAKSVTLYGLVNNAALGFGQTEAAGASTEQILNVNYLRSKRVTEAIVELIGPT